jgi:PAS domain S-box-containing protein
VESTTDYIFSVRVEGGRPVQTTHGRGCVAVTGYTTEEYDADPDLWYRMIHTEDREAVLGAVAVVLAGECPTPFPHRIVHKDGSLRWVGVTLVPRLGEQRQVTGYDGLIRDITVRKLSEEAVAENERYLQAILDSMSVGVFIVEPETGRITYANSYALRLIGAAPDAVVGRICREFLSPASATPAGAGAPANGTEGLFTSASGATTPVLRSSRTIEHQGRALTIESFFDIEERKRAAAERERLIGELQEALSKVKLLSGFLPICASCKKIRDDKGYWNQIETYIHEHSEAEFSHGLCPDCARKLYPKYFKPAAPKDTP